MGVYMDTKGKKLVLRTLKERGRTSLQGDPYKKFFSGWLGALVCHQGALATSKPAAEVSARGRDEPVVRHLPAVTPRTSLLGARSSDIPLQGASSSSTPAEGEGLRHLVLG
jgi:hypothetical protein